MKKRFTQAIAFILILSSCSQSTVFKEYRKIENMTWNRFEIIEFEVPVNEGDQLDFDLALRHHTNFPYDKFFVNITFNAPDGELRSADYDFDLKNEDGKWLAEGMGELWDINLPIRKKMPFYQGGICKVSIENIYPKFDTPGIIEIGLVVRRSED